MFQRCDHQHTVTPTPIGYLPQKEDLDLSNLSLSEEQIEALFSVSTEKWLKEIEAIRKYFMIFEQKLPPELLEELNKITMRFLKKDYADRITKSTASAGAGK
jgi:GTP-dependent phosphoenolpyruvate carboxykinase